MTLFYLLLFVVFVLASLSKAVAVQRTLPGNSEAPPNRLLAVLTACCIIAFSGLRSGIGDTYFYMHAYAMSHFTWDQIRSGKDIGFGVLQMVLQQISSNPQILVFTTALITNALLIYVLYKYSARFELSLYVYITSGMFIVSMNGMRQFLAAAIIFAASKWLFEGKWKPYMAVIAMTFTLHGSALIFVPIYFVVRRKAWTKLTFLLLAVSMLVVVGFNQFMQVLFTALQDTQYSDYQTAQAQGANVIRVLVDAVPLVIAFLGRDKLRSLYPNSDIVVNMSLLNLVVMIIATQNWIFARFSIYFGLYNLILISWIIRLFVARERKLMYFLILAFYLVYFVYENAVALRIIYRSSFLGIG
jgi:transmembrane protein EpsG